MKLRIFLFTLICVTQLCFLPNKAFSDAGNYRNTRKQVPSPESNVDANFTSSAGAQNSPKEKIEGLNANELHLHLLRKTRDRLQSELDKMDKKAPNREKRQAKIDFLSEKIEELENIIAGRDSHTERSNSGERSSSSQGGGRGRSTNGANGFTWTGTIPDFYKIKELYRQAYARMRPVKSEADLLHNLAIYREIVQLLPMWQVFSRFETYSNGCSEGLARLEHAKRTAIFGKMPMTPDQLLHRCRQVGHTLFYLPDSMEKHLRALGVKDERLLNQAIRDDHLHAADTKITRFLNLTSPKMWCVYGFGIVVAHNRLMNYAQERAIANVSFHSAPSRVGIFEIYHQYEKSPCNYNESKVCEGLEYDNCLALRAALERRCILARENQNK